MWRLRTTSGISLGNTIPFTSWRRGPSLVCSSPITLDQLACKAQTLLSVFPAQGSVFPAQGLQGWNNVQHSHMVLEINLGPCAYNVNDLLTKPFALPHKSPFPQQLSFRTNLKHIKLSEQIIFVFKTGFYSYAAQARLGSQSSCLQPAAGLQTCTTGLARIPVI